MAEYTYLLKITTYMVVDCVYLNHTAVRWPNTLYLAIKQVQTGYHLELSILWENEGLDIIEFETNLQWTSIFWTDMDLFLYTQKLS